MKNIIDSAMNSVKSFSLFDFSCLKIALLSLGILLGSYFSKFFSSKIVFVWITYIVTFAYIMYRTFKKMTE
ncbi:MAG: hypothetical protein ACERKN_11595 [Velocimicrobium sp.]